MILVPILHVAIHLSPWTDDGHPDRRRSAIWISALPKRRRAGRSGRESYLRGRPRRLNDEGRHLARLLADQGRTLREIGAELGVSHETVRGALREATAAVP